MADEKKPEAKPEAPSWFSHPDPFVEIVWILVFIFVVLYLLNGAINLLNAGSLYLSGSRVIGDSLLLTKITELINKIFSIYKYVAFGLSIALIWVIFYLHEKVGHLRTEEAKNLYVKKEETSGISNPQWERILNHIESINESDWRLAILEGDIMLDTLLGNMGLPGETMADKLKAVERSDFATIDNAWEAHKVRNQIAHEGPNFTLSHHETRRVIALYQSVFKEFRII